MNEPQEFTPAFELFQRTFASEDFKAIIERVHATLEEAMKVGKACAYFSHEDCPNAAVYILKKAGYQVENVTYTEPYKVYVSWYPKDEATNPTQEPNIA